MCVSVCMYGACSNGEIDYLFDKWFHYLTFNFDFLLTCFYPILINLFKCDVHGSETLDFLRVWVHKIVSLYKTEKGKLKSLFTYATHGM